MKTRVAVIVGVLALVIAACGGDRTAPTVADGGGGDGGGGGGNAVAIAAGKSLYDGSCVACHAEGGVGIDGLGKPLVGSEFINGLNDADLVEFLTVGRDTSDPANTSGVAMPAKGGNPSLTEADLQNIVAYLRSIN
ncbi:MAG: cytochrome c [Acidimicrobiia bacterium]|nr:cytochrome c [Acidimicrobiia bacterium]